jgi:hypothetical protein
LSIAIFLGYCNICERGKSLPKLNLMKLHFKGRLATPKYYSRIKNLSETNTLAYYAVLPSAKKGILITLSVGVKITNHI